MAGRFRAVETKASPPVRTFAASNSDSSLKARVAGLCRRIHELHEALGSPNLRFMEVCGTHTMAIFRHGIRHLLPDGIELISGPGCPVCVTSQEELEMVLELARSNAVTISTFGDMLRVPGAGGESLAKLKARGALVNVVYSPMDALEEAISHEDRTFCFIGVGFETTAPAVAATILAARARGVENFLVLSLHKTMPAALEALFDTSVRPAGDGSVSGLLCPGHVSAIIGLSPYEFLAREHGLACAIAGFEPDQILLGIIGLLEQLLEGRPRVLNCYPEAVAPQGNPRARQVMMEVFEETDAIWRGLGTIAGSGLGIREEFALWDASRRFRLAPSRQGSKTGCRCGEVITGRTRPKDCPGFGKACTPATPLGPCMVSSEGACAAWYRYGRAGIGVSAAGRESLEEEAKG